MKISIIMEALTGKFVTDTKRASAEFERNAKKMQKRAEDTGRAIGKALAAGAVIAGAALAAAVKNAVDRADELSKLSQKIGISTEALSGLSYAAELSDVSLQQLQGGITRLVRSQQDAASGMGDLGDTFKAIGVSVVDASGKLRDADAVLLDLADVFNKLPDGAEKTALAVDVFGRAGADLIPLLNSGSRGIRGMTDEAQELGLILDSETGKAAEAFNDNLTRLKSSAFGLTTELTSSLLPALVSITDTMVDLVKASKTAFSREGLFADDFFSFDSGAIAQMQRDQEEKASPAVSFIDGSDLPSTINNSESILEALRKMREEQDKVTAGRNSASDAAKRQAEAERELQKALEDEERAMEDARRIQADIQADILEAQEREMAQRNAALQVGKDLVSDLQFELELMKMSNVERATAIQLRGLDAEAVAEYGEKIAALNAELEANAKITQQMDGLRDASANLFEDLMSGSKSAGEAFRDLADSIIQNITRMIAQNFAESLFGNFGQTGGGSLGGVAQSLFGGLFGGGKAGGGPVAAGVPYMVGENGPEMFVPSTAGRISNASETRRMGGGSVINISVEGQVDMRSRQQLAADVGRASQKSLARSY